MKILAIVNWQETGGLKPPRYYFRKPGEWLRSPFSVVFIAESGQFVEQSFNNRLPIGRFTIGIDKTCAHLEAILGERNVGGCTAKIGEKIGYIGHGTTPERGESSCPSLLFWISCRSRLCTPAR